MKRGCKLGSLGMRSFELDLTSIGHFVRCIPPRNCFAVSTSWQLLQCVFANSFWMHLWIFIKRSCIVVIGSVIDKQLSEFKQHDDKPLWNLLTWWCSSSSTAWLFLSNVLSKQGSNGFCCGPWFKPCLWSKCCGQSQNCKSLRLTNVEVMDGYLTNNDEIDYGHLFPQGCPDWSMKSWIIHSARQQMHLN